VGDATKAREILGWQYVIRFEELVKEMVSNDCALLNVGKGSAVASPAQ
jgi:GDP-D-mannose dehydratase